MKRNTSISILYIISVWLCIFFTCGTRTYFTFREDSGISIPTLIVVIIIVCLCFFITDRIVIHCQYRAEKRDLLRLLKITNDTRKSPAKLLINLARLENIFFDQKIIYEFENGLKKGFKYHFIVQKIRLPIITKKQPSLDIMNNLQKIYPGQIKFYQTTSFLPFPLMFACNFLKRGPIFIKVWPSSWDSYWSYSSFCFNLGRANLTKEKLEVIRENIKKVFFRLISKKLIIETTFQNLIIESKLERMVIWLLRPFLLKKSTQKLKEIIGDLNKWQYRTIRNDYVEALKI